MTKDKRNVPVTTQQFELPSAPSAIEKGVSLKTLLDADAVRCLSHNLSLVYPALDRSRFEKLCHLGLESLELLQRGKHLSSALFEVLPKPYCRAIDVILESLTAPLVRTEKNGLGVFFYLPHVCFVAGYGLDSQFNGGKDPYETSMRAQYELTRRFTAEFSIRNFLINHQEKTLKRLLTWTDDPCPHVRRLCSEGTRPLLPWAIRIPSFTKDPTPCLKILERLKDDSELYVRRSVENHIGDIAKNHPELALRVCRSWLKGASPERRWLIRHALRYLAKRNNSEALKLRELAK
jgi:3-methyladenine DNA glycosylase AlkC